MWLQRLCWAGDKHVLVLSTPGCVCITADKGWEQKVCEPKLLITGLP